MSNYESEEDTGVLNENDANKAIDSSTCFGSEDAKVPETESTSIPSSVEPLEPVPREQLDNQLEPQRSIAGYLIGRTLGSGASGKVKLGIDIATNQHVALKIMDRDGISDRQIEKLRREITSMQSLDHPNILQLLDLEMNATYPKKAGPPKEVVLLVLELAPGGELFDFLMYSGPFSEKMARTHFSSLLDALQCCHERGIFHRDLKLENLLLSADYQLKVADFGLATIVTTDSAESDGEFFLSTRCGTPSYMAPEILQKNARYQGSKVDIWSAGVVLFIMMTGHPPFGSANRNDWWFQRVQFNQYDKFWSAHLRDCPDIPQTFQEFINTILVADPAHRPTLKEIRDHPWMQGEVLSPQELHRELAELKVKVVEIKMQQKQKALAAARERMAKSCNPFRSTSSRGLNVCVPPCLPDDLLETDLLYSSKGAQGLLNDLQKAFADMKAQVAKRKETRNNFKLKAIFECSSEGGLQQIAVVFQVYTMCIQENEISVLHLQRRAGDLFEYQKIYQQIYEAIKDKVTAKVEDIPSYVHPSKRAKFELSDEIGLV